MYSCTLWVCEGFPPLDLLIPWLPLSVCMISSHALEEEVLGGLIVETEAAECGVISGHCFVEMSALKLGEAGTAGDEVVWFSETLASTNFFLFVSLVTSFLAALRTIIKISSRFDFFPGAK